MMATFTHTPVLKDRCVELLAPALQGTDGVVVDGTLGLGGHSEAILETFPDVRLLGLDRDPEALAIARDRLEPFRDRVRYSNVRFDEMATELERHFPGQAPRGILLDLGVSSLQLDNPERGFSYLSDAELDMRMNPADQARAKDILAEWQASELSNLFRRYGDEPLAKRYADAICEARLITPIETADQLVAILDRSTPRSKKPSGHVAKRVFQALRVEVNRELESLERVLPIALGILAPGGRIVVMSYQSAEDRLVKHAIDQRTKSTTPVGIPIEVAADRPTFAWVVKREEASEDEIARNPRSRSVRLRAAEKLGDS
jgi:16S rRNA (cytosine1402-N4)-methyltransferase